MKQDEYNVVHHIYVRTAGTNDKVMYLSLLIQLDVHTVHLATCGYSDTLTFFLDDVCVSPFVRLQYGLLVVRGKSVQEAVDNGHILVWHTTVCQRRSPPV
jgi:hypothetical protein